jgi:hypothetical protein
MAGSKERVDDDVLESVCTKLGKENHVEINRKAVCCTKQR